jgi:hypothetical protein
MIAASIFAILLLIITAPLIVGELQNAGITGWTIAKFIIAVLVAAIYFVPFSIAQTRKSQNKFGIFMVNLLFGWTILGWIAATIWACAAPPKSQSPNLPT